MNESKLIERVETLEKEVARLRGMIEQPKPDWRLWLRGMYEAFEGDEDFQKATELGRKYRESLRPGKPKPKKRPR